MMDPVFAAFPGHGDILYQRSGGFFKLSELELPGHFVIYSYESEEWLLGTTISWPYLYSVRDQNWILFE
jgi:hypothetical protein